MGSGLQQELFKFTFKFYLCSEMWIQLRCRGVRSRQTAHWSNSFTPPHLFRQEIHQLFFFSLIPPPLRSYFFNLPCQTLIKLLSFTPLYKWMLGQRVYCWRVLNRPYVICSSVCTFRLIFIPSVCLRHVVFHVIDLWFDLGKQALSFNLILLSLEVYTYFCLNFNCFDCLTNGCECCWRCPGY